MKFHKLTPLTAHMLRRRFSAELRHEGIRYLNQWQQDVYNGLDSFVAMHEWVQYGDLERAAHHADIVDESLPAIKKYMESL